MGKLKLLLGTRSAAPLPPVGPTLPTTLTVPLSKNTFCGYGGPHLYYTGSLWLAVYSQDGVVVSDNYSTAPSTGNKFKCTKENRLVFRGNCTPTGVLPTGINDAYTLVIREYPTEADAIARTNWTGQQQTTTVCCASTYTIPARAMQNELGSYWAAPAHDIDLSKAFCIAPWPRTVVSARYPSGYTTTNEVLLESEDNFQLNHVAPVMGNYVVRQPGDYNPPYNDGVHDGTVDLLISWYGFGMTGTFGGTAPMYEDANWFTIVDADAPNTHWHQINMWCTHVKFLYCNFDSRRPTLDRGSFAPYAAGSSAIGAFRMALTSGTLTHEFIRVKGCNMAPRGITHEAGMNAMMISTNAATPVAPHHIFIENNTIGSGYDALNITKLFSGTPTLPGEHLYILGNTSFGDNTNDQFKWAGYGNNIKVSLNRIAASNGGYGAHPDFIQGLSLGLPAGGYGPWEFSYNDFTVPVASQMQESGQGIVLPFALDGSNWVEDLLITNNTYIGGYLNFVVLGAARRVIIGNNTVSINKNQVSPPAQYAPGDAQITLSAHCDDILIQDNILGVTTALNGATNVTQTNNIISANAAVGTYAISNVFAGAAYGLAINTHQKLVDAFKARPGGPADGTGASGNPIGRWAADGSEATPIAA